MNGQVRELKGISELGRSVILGIILACVICYVLYDIGFNNSAWCNMALEKFISFIGTFSRLLNHWGTKLFGEYQYQVPK